MLNLQILAEFVTQLVTQTYLSKLHCQVHMCLPAATAIFKDHRSDICPQSQAAAYAMHALAN